MTGQGASAGRGCKAPLVSTRQSQPAGPCLSDLQSAQQRRWRWPRRRCEHRPQACSDYWDAAGRQVFINGSTASVAATIWPPGPKLQVWPTQVRLHSGTPPRIVVHSRMNRWQTHLSRCERQAYHQQLPTSRFDRATDCWSFSASWLLAPCSPSCAQFLDFSQAACCQPGLGAFKKGCSLTASLF